MVKDIKIYVYGEVFYPGSRVQGTAVVTVDKRKKYNNILVFLDGRAQVLWTEDDKNQVIRRTNLVKYAEMVSVVWTSENSPSVCLPVGVHTFPFDFQLPHNIPHSFEGQFGQVRYEVGVEMSRPGFLKNNYRVSTLLSVKERMDLLRLCRAPKTVDMVKRVGFFWHNVGSVTTTVNLPHTGFAPGGTIPIGMHVKNETSRGIHIDGSLYRHDTFIESGGRQKLLDRKMVKITSNQIQGRDNLSFQYNMEIPRELFATLRGCHCISVEYSLVITAKVPWSINRKLRIPIVIANEASETVQQQFQPAVHVHGDVSPYRETEWSPVATTIQAPPLQQWSDPSPPTYSEAVGGYS